MTSSNEIYSIFIQEVLHLDISFHKILNISFSEMAAVFIMFSWLFMYWIFFSVFYSERTTSDIDHLLIKISR